MLTAWIETAAIFYDRNQRYVIRVTIPIFFIFSVDIRRPIFLIN